MKKALILVAKPRVNYPTLSAEQLIKSQGFRVDVVDEPSIYMDHPYALVERFSFIASPIPVGSDEITYDIEVILEAGRKSGKTVMVFRENGNSVDFHPFPGVGEFYGRRRLPLQNPMEVIKKIEPLHPHFMNPGYSDSRVMRKSS